MNEPLSYQEWKSKQPLSYQEWKAQQPKINREQEIKSNFLSRFGFGAMEPMIGAGQLLAHGLDAIAKPGSMAEGLSESVDSYWKSQKAQQEAANKSADIGFDVAGLAGNILSPANSLLLAKIPVGANMAGKIAQGLVTGGEVGAMLPSYTDDYLPEKIRQISQNSAIGGALPIVGKGFEKVGGAIADIIGGIGTHTGGEGIKGATKAGMEGGKTAEIFLDNLRENVPKINVLEAAKDNLQQIGARKAQSYREGMAKISKDKSILNFNGIDRSIKNAFDTVTYKGQVKNQKGADIVKKISDEIIRWKQLNPSEYHTPEGLDALKQKIGSIHESTPFEEKTVRKASGGIYNAIKNEIANQAPVYNKVMKDYSQGMELINEIERTLSLGKKSSEDTAMRKLQSLMRNNANTNYGNRLELASTLQEGGSDIMSGLAGQSLSSITPRGIGSLVAGSTAAGGAYLSNPLAIPLLALQSPRLIGEGAYYLGKGVGSANKALEKIPIKTAIINYLMNAINGINNE